ncbi:hypothetical protein [Microbacterium sp. SS28]|uniref:hypothetical protein n=1 Tax=Microbacterium sp. SS28 TaxID=2919948 RepID=UPI001FA96426|nr:hypothetical protein [Microbacterium sp. SS28]
MSTPEQPDSPPLTRKQMREIRNTGATPVIDADALAAAAASAPDEPLPADPTPTVEEPADAPPPVDESLPVVTSVPSAAPLARAVPPVLLPEPPVPDASVDLGMSPLTRRQARQQERIRTASVPVITPEFAAAYTAQAAAAASSQAEPDVDAEPEDPFAALGVGSGPIEQVPDEAEAEPEAAVTEAEPEAEPEREADAEAEPAAADPEPAVVEEQDDQAGIESLRWSEEAEPEASRTVAPDFGAALLAGDTLTKAPIASSFDDLITHSSSGSVATPNALILSQAPNSGPIVAPLSATGEVLITGTFNLPEGLGSTGHAPGTADGKEVDAVLVDGELPAHSSPTPIAASAAVSTAKTPGEIIKPPAPEKGGRLMLTLAITAGALALALVGVLILAFATGVF